MPHWHLDTWTLFADVGHPTWKHVMFMKAWVHQWKKPATNTLLNTDWAHQYIKVQDCINTILSFCSRHRVPGSTCQDYLISVLGQLCSHCKWNAAGFEWITSSLWSWPQNWDNCSPSGHLIALGLPMVPLFYWAKQCCSGQHFHNRSHLPNCATSPPSMLLQHFPDCIQPPMSIPSYASRNYAAVFLHK